MTRARHPREFSNFEDSRCRKNVACTNAEELADRSGSPRAEEPDSFCNYHIRRPLGALLVPRYHQFVRSNRLPIYRDDAQHVYVKVSLFVLTRVHARSNGPNNA